MDTKNVIIPPNDPVKMITKKVEIAETKYKAVNLNIKRYIDFKWEFDTLILELLGGLEFLFCFLIFQNFLFREKKKREFFLKLQTFGLFCVFAFSAAGGEFCFVVRPLSTSTSKPAILCIETEGEEDMAGIWHKNSTFP